MSEYSLSTLEVSGHFSVRKHVPIMPGFPSFVPTVPNDYHVVAPDLPGFGFSDAPDRKRFNYTFENLAKSIDRFTQTIGLQPYAIYVFKYWSLG
jgi:pimeloyl-ACP methyl ester carboxylesterase